MHVSIGQPSFGHAAELRGFIDPDLLQHPDAGPSLDLRND